MLDTYLIKYFTDRFDKIIKGLCERHLERKEIFRQIETAHKNELYFVSIPSILTQVDGISYDYTKKMFFLKDKKNDYLPQIAGEITKISRLSMSTFLTPLTNQTPIMAHESILDEFPINLNRHNILHGIDKDFGNKKNSLKCISLLKYLSDILAELENE
jgi:hypothetical protein